MYVCMYVINVQLYCSISNQFEFVSGYRVLSLQTHTNHRRRYHTHTHTHTLPVSHAHTNVTTDSFNPIHSHTVYMYIYIYIYICTQPPKLSARLVLDLDRALDVPVLSRAGDRVGGAHHLGLQQLRGRQHGPPPHVLLLRELLEFLQRFTLHKVPPAFACMRKSNRSQS